jgi:hypothetical protein
MPDFERMSKEVVVVYFQALFHNSPGWTKETLSQGRRSQGRDLNGGPQIRSRRALLHYRTILLSCLYCRLVHGKEG